MENKIQVFTNDQFGTVRTVEINGEPHFVAADVCRALEIEPTATRRLDEDEVSTLRLTQGTPNGGNPNINVITESGLYSLVLGSRKPEAKTFKRWITHEVLPQIRQTGGYIPVEKKETDEDTDIEIMSKALSIMQKTMKDKDKFIIEAKPKLEAYTVFLDTTGVYNFDIWAGSMNCGRNTLMEFLRKNKVLQKGNSNNIPYRRFIASGYFKVKFKPCYDGVVRPQTFITPIGAEYITKFCKKHGFAIGNEVA